MPKDAITLVFAFSRASVLSVRISSFVHGRSFLVGFAISAPHALCKTKKHRLKRCSLIARHDTTRTSRNHRAVDKSYAVAQAISRPAGAPTATNSDGATLQYPRRHPAPPWRHREAQALRMLRNLDPLAVAAWPAPRTNHGLFRAMGKEHHRHFRFVSRTNVAVLGLTHVPIISPFEKVPRNDRAFCPVGSPGSRSSNVE
jgi:hypothetical protein